MTKDLRYLNAAEILLTMEIIEGGEKGREKNLPIKVQVEIHFLF